MGRSADAVHLRPMIDALARRGPDDRGTWLDPNGGAVLGHTRLSIIDLSCAGRQPMTRGGGRYWITFNGEIYNYREIRLELESAGEHFSSHSDTEVVLAGWERWGAGVVPRLRGMFAFAVWDTQARQLTLVRDRLGIKPMLWARIRGGLIFASELKALLASGLVEPALEPRAVFDLLATGSVCQPRTMVRAVQHLEPGTSLTVDAGLREVSDRYWDLPAAVEALKPQFERLTYADAVRLTRLRLEEACAYHLVADVPVGSFLSGGIDSAAVTALMAQRVSEPVSSFSVGFDVADGQVNELEPAGVAAKHIGCKHTAVVIAGRDASAAFDDLVGAIDQPSDDGANTYFVSRAAAAGVKVALSGLGGDELFAGYPHFQTLMTAQRDVPAWLDSLLRLIHRIRPNRWTQSAALRPLSAPERYARLRRGLSDASLEETMSRALRPYFARGFVEDYLVPLVERECEVLRQVSLVECRHYLRNTLLRDADVMSMRHGLEVRPIMLDHPLVEHALALPPGFKIRAGRHKAVLKDAVADLLPARLLRRPKTGFELPLGHWLRTELRDRLLVTLDGASARAVFSPPFLQRCRTMVDDRQAARLLWTVLVLLTWMEQYAIALPASSAAEAG